MSAAQTVGGWERAAWGREERRLAALDAERPVQRVEFPAALWASDDADDAAFAPYMREAQELADRLDTIVDVVVTGGAVRDAYATVAPRNREVHEYDRRASQWKDLGYCNE